MKYILSICAILLIASTGVQAQKKPVTLDLNYNYSMPLGSLKNDFIDHHSARGFAADVMYWAKPTWAIGGSFGFQDFYQKYPRAQYKLSDGSDISAVISNSLQTIPVMVKTHFSPLAGKGSFIRPYVTAAAGVNLINYSQYLGEFGGSSNQVKFTAQAGAGFHVPFKKSTNTGLLFGANYQYTGYNTNGIDNLNMINLHAGIRIGL